MRFKWIIFDADGTLFNYDAAEFNALKNAFSYLDLPFSDNYLNIYRKFNKVLWKDFECGKFYIPLLNTKRFDLLLNEKKKKIEPRLFSTAYLDQLSLRHDLIEGVEELLQKLSGKIGMVLMTNGIKEVQRSRLNLSTIERYFSDIIISDEVGIAKPDIKIFEIAYNRMSRPKKDAILMVGDNLGSDIKGGVDFGIETCWYNPDQAKIESSIKATYEIKDLSEILEIVEIE